MTPDDRIAALKSKLQNRKDAERILLDRIERWEKDGEPPVKIVASLALYGWEDDHFGEKI